VNTLRRSVASVERWRFGLGEVADGAAKVVRHERGGHEASRRQLLQAGAFST